MNAKQRRKAHRAKWVKIPLPPDMPIGKWSLYGVTVSKTGKWNGVWEGVPVSATGTLTIEKILKAARL